jgi:hypothetical protein
MEGNAKFVFLVLKTDLVIFAIDGVNIGIVSVIEPT